jgi:GntR family transcriptional regulator
LKKIENEPLYLKVEKEILKVFKDENPTNNRLQSEEELAVLLGVSRHTVRVALNSLWKKGYLTKRHGKGNFLHRSAFEAKMRIDLYHNFSDLIRTAGYTPSIKKSAFVKACPETDTKSLFALKEGEQIIKFNWTYYADHLPAIFVDLQLPESFLKKEPKIDDNDSLRDFLEEYCQQDLAQCVANIKALNDDSMSELFSLEENRALIMWEELFYNIYDQMICYNKIYFNPSVMELSLLIKI